MRSSVSVGLPAGPTSITADWTEGTPGDTVIIAHGAGAGKDHPFLLGFAGALAERGVATVRFNFPYVEQGRRMPGPAPHAVATCQDARVAWIDGGGHSFEVAGRKRPADEVGASLAPLVADFILD